MPRARLYNIDRSFLCLPPAGGSGAERVMDRHATSPSVWTGRALQAECDDLEVIGLAHLYPALAWSVCAPGHHGYPRAPDLILRKALRGR